MQRMKTKGEKDGQYSDAETNAEDSTYERDLTKADNMSTSSLKSYM